MRWVRRILIMARRVVDSALADVHTHLPGKIISYTAATNTASIQPCLKRVRTGDPDNETVNLPVLDDVPVHQWGSGKLLATVPPAAGAYGLLHVSERDIEQWLLKGDIQNPGSTRRFDLSDAFFVPGYYPITPDGDNGALVVPVATDRMSLRTRLGTTEVSVVDDNTIEIKTPAGSVTVDAAGLVTVGSGGSYVATAAKVEALWTALYTAFSGWTPVPQDGGAALKTAFMAGVGPTFDAKSTNLKAD